MIPEINQALLVLSSWVELSILAKATVLLVLGLFLVWLSGNARASMRHLLLSATFAALLLLPLIVATAPEMTVDVPVNYPAVNSITELSAVSAPENLTTGTGSYFERRDDGGSRSMLLPATIVCLGWATGVLLLSVSLAINLWRLRQLRRNGLPWLEMYDHVKLLASECGVRRKIEILLDEDIKIPLTCGGVRRPVIVLPSDARRWSGADLRRVLVHELEHVKRGDWFIQLAARATCALYWFHPLVWAAWRRLCLEAERACDDAVIQRAESIEYADQLVLLARRLSKPSAALPAPGMANRSDLSIRLSAILDGRQRRGRAGLPAVAGITLAAGFLVLTIAPLKAVMQTAVTQTSLSVTAEIKSDSPEDISIDNSGEKINTGHDRKPNLYVRNENNSGAGIKRLSVGSDKPPADEAGEKPVKKRQAESDAGELQSEQPRAQIKNVKSEGIDKQDDAEQRKHWAEMENARAADIIKQQKLDAEQRKRWAEMEDKRLRDDAEQRKRQSQMQAIKDQAFARQAGIIPK